MLKNYSIDNHGVIHQDIIEQFLYNKEYLSYYDAFDTTPLALLRISNIICAIGEIPTKILDYGCGDNKFVDMANKITKCVGYDIIGHYDKNIIFDNYDIVTFFDSLEHIDELSIIRLLNTKYIVISVPECHYINDNWFDKWKHRKPNEHIHHFNQTSLTNMMFDFGYKLIHSSNIEDAIRKPIDELPNILTCIYENCTNRH